MVSAMATYEAGRELREEEPQGRFSMPSHRISDDREATSPSHFRHSSLSPLAQPPSPFLSPVPSLCSSPSSSPFRSWAPTAEEGWRGPREVPPRGDSALPSQAPSPFPQQPMGFRQNEGERSFVAAMQPRASEAGRSGDAFPRPRHARASKEDACTSARQSRNSFSFPPVVPESPFCKIGSSSLSLLSKKTVAQTPFRAPNSASPAAAAQTPSDRVAGAAGEARQPAALPVQMVPAVSRLRTPFSVSPSRFSGLHGTPGRGPLLLSELDTPFHLVRMNKGTTFLAGRHAKTAFQPAPAAEPAPPFVAETPGETPASPHRLEPPPSGAGSPDFPPQFAGEREGTGSSNRDVGGNVEQNLERAGSGTKARAESGAREGEAGEPAETHSYMAFYPSAGGPGDRNADGHDASEPFQGSYDRLSSRSAGLPAFSRNESRGFAADGEGPFAGSRFQRGGEREAEEGRDLGRMEDARVGGDSGREARSGPGKRSDGGRGKENLFSAPSPTNAAAAEILRSRQLLQKAERMLRASTVVAAREKPEEGKRSLSEPRPQNSSAGLPRPSDEENVMYAAAGVQPDSAVYTPSSVHPPQSAAFSGEAPDAYPPQGVHTPHGRRADPTAASLPSRRPPPREELAASAWREAEPDPGRRRDEAQPTSSDRVAEGYAFSAPHMHLTEEDALRLKKEASGANPLLGSWLLEHADGDRKRETGREDETGRRVRGNEAGVQGEAKADEAPRQHPSRCTTAGSEPLSSSSSGLHSTVQPGAFPDSPQTERVSPPAVSSPQRRRGSARVLRGRSLEGTQFSSLSQMGHGMLFSHDSQVMATERAIFPGKGARSPFFLSVDSRFTEARTQSTAAPPSGLSGSALLGTHPAAHRLERTDTADPVPALALPPARSQAGKQVDGAAHAFRVTPEPERAQREAEATPRGGAGASVAAPEVQWPSDRTLACSSAGAREEERGEEDSSVRARWEEGIEAAEREEDQDRRGDRSRETRSDPLERDAFSHSSSHSGFSSLQPQQTPRLDSSPPLSPPGFRHSPFPLSPRRETEGRGEHPLACTADFGAPAATDTENTPSPLSFRSASSKSISSSPSSLYHRGLAARGHFSFSFFSPFRDRGQRRETGANSGGTSPATGSMSPHLEFDAGRGVPTPRRRDETVDTGQRDYPRRGERPDPSVSASSCCAESEAAATESCGGSAHPGFVHPGIDSFRDAKNGLSVSAFPRHVFHTEEGCGDRGAATSAGRGGAVQTEGGAAFPDSSLQENAPHRPLPGAATAAQQYQEQGAEASEEGDGGVFSPERGGPALWGERGPEGERDTTCSQELRNSNHARPATLHASTLSSASPFARRDAVPMAGQAEHLHEEGCWRPGDEETGRRTWGQAPREEDFLHARGRDPYFVSIMHPTERDANGRPEFLSTTTRTSAFQSLARSGEVYVHQESQGKGASGAAVYSFERREEPTPFRGRQISPFEQSLQALHEDFLDHFSQTPRVHATASGSVEVGAPLVPSSQFLHGFSTTSPSRFPAASREGRAEELELRSRDGAAHSDDGRFAGAFWRAHAETESRVPGCRTSMSAFPASGSHGRPDVDRLDNFEEDIDDDVAQILPMVQFVNAELVAAGFEVLHADFPASLAPGFSQGGVDGRGLRAGERMSQGGDERPSPAAAARPVGHAAGGRVRNQGPPAYASANGGSHPSTEHRDGMGRGTGDENGEKDETVERRAMQPFEGLGGGEQEQRRTPRAANDQAHLSLRDTGTMSKNATDEAYIQSEVYVHRVLEAMTDKLHEVLAAYRTRGERMGELRREAATAAGLTAKCNELKEEKDVAAKQISSLRSRVTEVEREKAELAGAMAEQASLAARLQEAEKAAQALRGQARLHRNQLRQKELEKERLAERLETVLREEQSRETRARRALESLVSPSGPFASSRRLERGEKHETLTRRPERGALAVKNANKLLVEVAQHYEGKVKALQREIASLSHALEVSALAVEAEKSNRETGWSGRGTGSDRNSRGALAPLDEFEERDACMHFTTVHTHPETWSEQRKHQAARRSRSQKTRVSGSVPSLLSADAENKASSVWTVDFRGDADGEEAKQEERSGFSAVGPSPASDGRGMPSAVAHAAQRRSRSLAASFTTRERDAGCLDARTRFSLSCCSEGRGRRMRDRSDGGEGSFPLLNGCVQPDIHMSRVLEQVKDEKIRLEARLARSRRDEEETQRLRVRIVELQSRVEELEADLLTRPTNEAHRQLQQQLLDLQDELNPKKQESWRRAEPRSLMRQDRLQHKLRSSTVELRNEEHVALLQRCCLALNCSHPETLPAAIKRVAATSHRLPPLERFFEFVTLLAAGRLPAASEADVILSSLVAMSTARHAHKNYLQLRRAFAQAVQRDLAGTHSRSSAAFSFSAFEEDLEDMQDTHAQQFQRLQQAQLAGSSSSAVSGNDARERRVKETLSLLRMQHQDATALFQKAAQEETQALRCLLAPRASSRGRRAASTNASDACRGGEEVGSGGDGSRGGVEEKELMHALRKRLAFSTAEECASKVQAALGRVDALAGFFRILCDMLEIPTAGATFAQVEAAVASLIKESQEQQALLEEQQKHLLQQHNLLVSLQHSVYSPPLPTIREAKGEDEEEEREGSPKTAESGDDETGIPGGGDEAPPNQGTGGVSSRERSRAEPRDVSPNGEGIDEEKREERQTESEAHTVAAVATVNALQQLLKVDRATLILPKLSEILGRVQRLTNAPPLSPEPSSAHSASQPRLEANGGPDE
uniref:Uncharacterized protein n=1 Tax=Neospora caninum (strain Liverpool) TaxID=572307 RepID=A0A0F7URE2_NEOCL|nr:TPA: hypothetical protein BN1204_063720 [Neospora caninum Liverpool]